MRIKRALISVSDKTGLIPLAKELARLRVEIFSTGGTLALLHKEKIKAKSISELTGFPEILDGRVKTLHPKVHGGLLFLRSKAAHKREAKKQGILPIDLVVVNLYPFAKTIQKSGTTLKEAVEQIDIGGPSMLRSAAKNYKSVAVVCNPGRYKDILKELDVNSGILSDKVLVNLAIEAFYTTSRYDNMIYHFLNERLKSGEISNFPRELQMRFLKIQDLRYGENPHQVASFYRDFENTTGLAKMKQLHGKELSFNNIVDLNAAVDIVKEFGGPAAVAF